MRKLIFTFFCLLCFSGYSSAKNTENLQLDLVDKNMEASILGSKPRPPKW